jgi:hypothetical protein
VAILFLGISVFTATLPFPAGSEQLCRSDSEGCTVSGDGVENGDSDDIAAECECSATQGFEEAVEPAGVRSCRGRRWMLRLRNARCHNKTCSQFLVLGSWFAVLGFELFSAPAYAVFGDFD